MDREAINLAFELGGKGRTQLSWRPLVGRPYRDGSAGGRGPSGSLRGIQSERQTMGHPRGAA